jgi:hypothetical protein
MRYIAYMSISAPYLPNEATDAIAMQSAIRNEAKGITGILFKRGRYFVQYIEGEGDKIEETFERIKVDERHSDVVVLMEGEREERLFNDWHMQSNEVIIKVLMKKLQDSGDAPVNRVFYFLSALMESS